MRQTRKFAKPELKAALDEFEKKIQAKHDKLTADAAEGAEDKEGADAEEQDEDATEGRKGKRKSKDGYNPSQERQGYKSDKRARTGGNKRASQKKGVRPIIVGRRGICAW